MRRRTRLPIGLYTETRLVARNSRVLTNQVPGYLGAAPLNDRFDLVDKPSLEGATGVTSVPDSVEIEVSNFNR